MIDFLILIWCLKQIEICVNLLFCIRKKLINKCFKSFILCFIVYIPILFVLYTGNLLCIKITSDYNVAEIRKLFYKIWRHFCTNISGNAIL